MLFKGKSDPDLASMQVARALAGVRRRSSSDDGVKDADVVEVETVPRHRSQESDSVIMEPVSMSFDERFSKADSTLDYYDRGDEDEDEDDDEDDYGEDDDAAAKALRQVRERRTQASNYFSVHPDRRPVSTFTTGSRYSDDEDQSADEPELAYEQDEQEPAAAAKSVAQPQNVSPPSAIRPLPTVPVPTKSSSIPVLAKNVVTSSPPGEKSKTASLIEMYREKEKTGTPSNLPPLGPIAPLVPTPAPLRLPVRKDAPAPAPTTIQTIQTPPKDLDPPKPIVEDSGRASPIRYIHGAPLHNVVEEEEEE